MKTGTQQRETRQGEGAMRRFLREDRGATMLPSLVVGFMVVVIASTAIFKGIFQAHDSNMRIYRKVKALEALQNEMEYWKAEVSLRGASHQRPYGRYQVVLESDSRRSNDAVLASFEPAAQIRPLGTTGQVQAFEITVSITWPEGDKLWRETMTTAVNPLY